MTSFLERRRRLATHWEKILANHISPNEGLVSRVYQDISKLNSGKPDDTI